MWQPYFGKTIIMHKNVGVYILVLMYNSFSMCYVGNIVENLKIYIYIPFWKISFYNEMDANFLHIYEFNLIQCNCITLDKTSKNMNSKLPSKPNCLYHEFIIWI
jgi:hypothetical protein